jgi:protein SCO1/2
VYRQIYGEVIHLPILVEPLKELIWGAQASANTLEEWVDGLRLLCTVFDPASGRYRFDYSVIIGAVIGALSLTGLGIFLVRAWRRV